MTRPILASGDLSAILRQGAIMTIRHPLLASRSFLRAFEAIPNKAKADEFLTNLKAHPRYDEYERAGMELSEIGTPTAEEMFFRSRFIDQVPGLGQIVRGSERHFATYLNELRFGAMDDFMRRLEGKNLVMGADDLAGDAVQLGFADKQAFVAQARKLRGQVGETWDVGTGRGAVTRTWTQPMDDLADLEAERFLIEQRWAKFVNHATGKGDFPKWFAGEGHKAASVLFFAPRYLMSVIQTPLDIFRPGTPLVVRKEIANHLVAALGVGASILTMAKAGGADVGLDPLSSDFGKIQVGSVQLNVWGGFQPLFRTAAQFTAGGGNSRDTDEFFRNSRPDIVARFLGQKLSPPARLGAELGIAGLVAGREASQPPKPGEPRRPLGERFQPKNLVTGQPIDLTSPTSAASEVVDRILPLFAQDVMEVLREEVIKDPSVYPWNYELGDRPERGLLALPGVLGVGIQAFRSDLEKFGDSRLGGRGTFKAASPEQRQAISRQWRQLRRRGFDLDTFGIK